MQYNVSFISDNSQNINLCFFGQHVSQSETALTEYLSCCDELKDFYTLDESAQEIIVARSCLRETDDNVKICQNHVDLLGDSFLQKVHPHRSCLWPSHSKNRNVKAVNLRNPFPSSQGDERKQSMYLYSNHGILLPFQSKVCKDCKVECCRKLAGFVEEFVKTPEIRRRALDLENLVEISPTSSPSQPSMFSQASSQSSYKPPSQEQKKTKKHHLDSLLKANDINVNIKSCLTKKWDEVNTRRHQQVLNYAGAGVAAVLQTIAPENDDSGLLYQKLTESSYVEKHLDSEVPLSDFYAEIINTANGLSTFDEQKQYFSTLYGMPNVSFKILNQFNRNPNNVYDSGSEDEDDDTFDRSKVNKNLFFNFNFTYHLWISAVKHRKRYGYGMAPVIREKSFKWYYDIDLLTTIFDYVVNPMNTQRNSYGVFNIKQENGEIATIGRVIRHLNNSDMVKNIQAHLRGLGMAVPSASFLFKFLTYLPAASTKEMKGVNNIQEDAMRAFSTLDNIIETYATNYALSEDERINLKSCLSTSKTYLKTEYFNNLSVTNPILSHCVACLVSDPKDNPKFIEECAYSHESTTRCDKCELPYETISVLEKLMLQFKDSILSEYDAAVIEKKLNDSKAAILQYQSHLVKVFCQEREWQRLMDQKDPQTVFFEIDWGMKILPRRYRGKQSEWYGLNGMSNHIGCFTRIVPATYEDDGITPKTYRKQVDAYASIVKDSSKQDALTTAAIVRENLAAYKKNYPDVKRVYIRSDNAGCYKTNKLIQALYSLEIDDLTIMGYVYSAPCDGKSVCDTYAAIIKHHLAKMVSSGIMDITKPEELAKAITAAAGIANVVVMIGSFSFENDIYFKKIDKITDLNTVYFRKNYIRVWKHGCFGEGHDIAMNKIPFPSAFHCEIVGSELPRRNKKQTLIYRQTGETEIMQGEVDDFDDNLEELEGPIMEGSIYKCPNPNCDAEYLTLGNFFDHQINRNCFQKTKLRTESVGSYFEKLYIEKYSMNQDEKLSKSERRYKHMLWNEDGEEYISLLPVFSQYNYSKESLFCKGFAGMNFRSKNPIHQDVRAFVKMKFDEGEMTNRHLSYPKIVSAIENEKDANGLPRFFPNKWLDAQQVSYLISKFIKEKGAVSHQSALEPTEEDIFVNASEENYVRRRDAIQSAVQQMQIQQTLTEQSHPVLMDDGKNICDIAKDYYDNPKGKSSWIMQRESFNDEILPILEAIGTQPQGRQKRKAATAIVQFVKNQCGCIPKRRSKNA